MPHPARTVFAALLLVGTTVAAARPLGPVPALGPLLDPVHGVWANARARDARGEATLAIPGLARAVRIVYDDRRVPHIFAEREEDAYRALGWVVARDRLLQLSVQTLGASGRVTELAGERALPLDQEMRRLGLPRAAERRLAALGDTTPGARLAAAYAAGVNAWIDALDATTTPVEFKLLGIAPARWEPINSMHLMGRMGYTLAFIAPELDRLRAASRVGDAAAASLFPAAQPIVEPIQPNGQVAPRVDAVPIPPPGAPLAAAAGVAAALDRFFPEQARQRRAGADAAPSWLASNNWAVAPARTAAGHALLAGDPHLELTLPSIWYEAHLVVPGVLDVYGVTIPGAPGIVIGFNRDVAWTFTNTGADVLDLYAETVDDASTPTRYRLDGAWRPLELRVETYRGKRGEIVAVDTVRYTHRGPMQRLGAGGRPAASGDAAARWLSMRWTVLEPSDELTAFQRAARARSVAEFQATMARHYRAPAQNMLVADRAGTIAIRSTGAFPVRPGDGRGDVIRDGATRASDWRGYLPPSAYPRGIDPTQGYLASANQQPVDPRDARAGGAYWGGSYEAWRALRLNALLRQASAVTPDSMRRWQTDAGSARADWFVPHFLAAADARLAGAASGPGSAGLAEARRLLAQWDRRYDRANTRAVLFEAAMRELAARTWDELLAPSAGGPDTAAARRGGSARGSASAGRVATPDPEILAVLLADSASPWWDDRRTRTVERRDDVLAASLAAALARVRAELGAPEAGGWTWSRARPRNVHHLLRIPALGALGLAQDGGPNTLSPLSTNAYGPSWRMVVELGPELRAWGVYPGGQSGDPSSRGYTDRLPRWLAGELDTLRVPRVSGALPPGQVGATITLSPAGGR